MDSSVYHKLILLMMRAKRHMFVQCEKSELTPVQGMMLMILNPDEAKSMNELSEIMGCDASNITGLIDRLDSHRLIERTTAENDRRVKKIRLSKKGCDCREQLLDSLREAEAIDLKKLSDNEIEVLSQLLARLI